MPKESKNADPDCFKCAHHHITWDAAFPYGCKAIGFKSRLVPALEVRRTSGEKCLLFEPSNKTGSSEQK